MLCVGALAVTSLSVLCLVAVCVAQRFAYPFELSWMEGCIVDHARRAAAGRPIHGPPSSEFIALLYTPLSHYVASWFIRAGMEGFVAVRALSILGITGAGLIGMWLASRATQHKWIGLLVPVLIASTYFDVNAYYDVGRPDNLLAFFCVLAVTALSLRTTARALPLFVIAALGALFTKQSSVIFIAALLAGLFVVRRRLAVLAGVALATVGGAMAIHLQKATDGWLYVYTVELPSSLGWNPLGLVESLATDFFGSFALPTTAVILTAAVAMVTRSRSRRALDSRQRTFRVLLIGTVAAGIFSATSRATVGGAENALIPYAVMGSVFFPVAVVTVVERFGDVMQRAVGWHLGLLVLAIAAAGGLADPSGYIPTKQDEVRWRRFRTELTRYGPPQRLWVPCHGAALGAGDDAPMRPHLITITNYIGRDFSTEGERKLPEDLTALIEEQYFRAVVMRKYRRGLQKLIKRYYKPDDSAPVFVLPVFSGWHPGPERIWIPRGRPRAQ